MAKVIVYSHGQQYEVEEKDLKLYNPFPPKEQNGQESGSSKGTEEVHSI